MFLVYFDFFIVIISIMITAMSFRLIYLWTMSIRYSPKLVDKTDKKLASAPKVSIILPARNEYKYIKKCVDSLLRQDYQNFELILVNDKSTDSTREIMEQYAQKDHKVKVINLDHKPDDWIGKSWACWQGYLQSEGEFLLFTDADTYHKKNTIRLAIQYVKEYKLDALSLLPRVIAYDFFVRVTLPFLTLYQHTYISPLNINDPNKSAVNFLAQFYMIKKTVYEKIGTHKAVKEKFSEDLAIGEILKKSSFRMNMLRGENNVSTDTIRNPKLIFNQVSRYIIPYFQEYKMGAVIKTLSEFTIMFLPFPFFVYSLLSFGLKLNYSLNILLFLSSLIAILNIIILSSLQSKYAQHQKAWYGLGAPIGACIFSFSFVIGLTKAIFQSPIAWRERKYNATV